MSEFRDNIGLWPMSGFRDSIGLWLAPDFETFATDCMLHRHCNGCGGCILDSRHFVLTSSPLYCVGCRDNILDSLPKQTSPPWKWTENPRP